MEIKPIEQYKYDEALYDNIEQLVCDPLNSQDDIILEIEQLRGDYDDKY